MLFRLNIFLRLASSFGRQSEANAEQFIMAEEIDEKTQSVPHAASRKRRASRVDIGYKSSQHGEADLDG